MTETAAPHRSAVSTAPSRLLSDGRLTQRATKGDRSAFEAIFNRYHQELYRFCLAMVGNPQDAQDALQNTMVKVLRALPGETRDIKLKPWLYRIARNEAVETVRRRRDNTELEPEHASSAPEIAETAEARNRLRRLMADLGELPDRQRGALVMRELSGLGFDEIGTAFQTSAAVARQTVYEARLNLRQMEEGREMSCDTVMQELSDADGRVTRRREIRAHVRSCANCRAFRDSITERRTDFAAIAPLPIAVSLGLLHGIFTGQASAAVGSGAGAAAGGAAGGGAAAGGAAGGSVAGTVGAGAGKVIATSAIIKSAATVAVVAAVGVTAAGGSGLIDVPVLGVSSATKNVSKPATSPRNEGTAPSAHNGLPASGEHLKAGHHRGDGKGRAESGRQRARSRHHGTAGKHSRGHRTRRSHGQAHSKGHGRPAELPAASQHGQQTAAAHKSPHASPPTGGAPKSKSPPASSTPPPTSSRPPKEESVETSPAPSPSPSPPPSEPGSQGNGGGPAKETGGIEEAPEP